MCLLGQSMTMKYNMTIRSFPYILNFLSLWCCTSIPKITINASVYKWANQRWFLSRNWTWYLSWNPSSTPKSLMFQDSERKCARDFQWSKQKAELLPHCCSLTQCTVYSGSVLHNQASVLVERCSKVAYKWMLPEMSNFPIQCRTVINMLDYPV